MMRVRKKALDKSTEALIGQAAKAGTSLPFDRYEAQVPACGFGRMGLDCKACTQGPCRINPFETSNGTTCGRDRESTVAANFLRLISDGAVAMAGYAGAEASVAETVFAGITASNEGASADTLLKKAIEVAMAGYGVLNESDRSDGSDPSETQVGIGTLDPDKMNVLLAGGIPAARAKKIAAELSANPNVNVVAAAGAEGAGVPVAGNYNSEEALLVSAALDAVVSGKSCVAPGFVALATQQRVMVMDAAEFDPAKLLEAAEAHLRVNSGRSLGTRYAPAKATIGFTAATFAGVSADQWEKLAGAGVRGVAVIGGCNNVVETQDGSIVRQALEFLKNDVMVIASGCAAVALAKAGYMDVANVAELAGNKLRRFLAELSDVARVQVPAVIEAGTCWEMPGAVAMAQMFAKQLKVKLALAMPEISRPASWSTALAVAAQGVPTYVGPILPLDGGLGTVGMLNGMLRENGGSLVGPGQVGDPEAVVRAVLSAEWNGEI